MARKTDEILIASLKRAYLNGEGSLAALALRFHVGERTVKRLSSEGGWEALRLARGTVVEGAVRDRLQAAPSEFDRDNLLLVAINSLFSDVQNIPAKSKEGAASAMVRLIELYSKFHPMTMRELADIAIAIPNFNPREFARLLRERLDSAV
jgi:hypothetical protein